MLAEADLGLTNLAFSQNDPKDERLYVMFDMYPHQDGAATEAEGRPIFVDREYITIIVPGDKDNIVHRPVNALDKQRFPKQYAAFKNGNTDAIVGTPLSAWPVITRAQVRELEYFNVRTVEHLAELADNHAQKFAGIQKLRQQARDFLASAKDSAALTKMRAELDQRDNALEAANRNLAALTARLEAVESEQKQAKASK